VLLIAAAASVLVGRSSRRQLAILRPVIGPSPAPEYARA
jgi:hypothetical protein